MIFVINCRTNTYPKIPERYRLRSSDGIAPSTIAQNQMIPGSLATPPNRSQQRSVSLHGQSTPTPMLSKISPNNHNNKTTDNKDGTKDEEVIYF